MVLFFLFTFRLPIDIGNILSHKILIIDDDAALQEQLAWALKNDFELVQCGDRDQALKAAVTEIPNLVLLDLHLPMV